MKLSRDQRNALTQQVARRLEKMDDERLADLEGQTRANAAVAASAPAGGLTRRNFMREILIFTGAGLAVGGAAAFAKENWDATQAAGQTVSALDATGLPLVSLPTAGVPVADSAAQLALLQDSLAAAQAALAEMRPQLSAALAENANLKNNLSAAQNTLLERQQEADGLRGQLSNSQVQISNFQRLVGLFDQLDAQGLDSAAVNGLAAAAVGFGSVLGVVPLLTQGLGLARGLFDTFETQFPAIRASLAWLKGRMDGLSAGMAAVESAAAQAVDSLEPVTDRLAQLIDYILGHLPFGIGRSIKQALTTLNELYRSLPDLVSGANNQVVGVLSAQFGEGEKGISKVLLKPVRDNAFTPAEQLAGQVNSLHEVYVRDLHDPIVGAVDRRAAVRKEIAEFRQSLGL